MKIFEPGEQVRVIEDRPSSAPLKTGDIVIVTGMEGKTAVRVRDDRAREHDFDWLVEPNALERIIVKYSPEQSGDTDEDI